MFRPIPFAGFVGALFVLAGCSANEDTTEQSKTTAEASQQNAQPRTVVGNPYGRTNVGSGTPAASNQGAPSQGAPSQGAPSQGAPSQGAPSRTVKTGNSTNTGKSTQAAGGKEVVFDPNMPPPGYTTCHRNHCHKVDGGVASYAQVMAEIGATRIVGQPKKVPPPPAPADVAAAPADAQTTASGLKTKVLKTGNGQAKATADSIVQLEFTAWTTDGKAFFSTIADGRPLTIQASKLGMDGFTEGVLLMSVGEERRLWIPQNLAFKGRKGAPAGMIVMDIELLEIK